MTPAALRAAFIFVATAHVLRTDAAPTVSNLTIEYVPVPVVAIDVSFNARPRFAWMLAGGRQASYRIVIASTPTVEKPAVTVWDSGTVASNQSTQISFGGSAPLVADADYDWTLTVVFEDGTPISPPVARFGTGPDATSWAQSAVWLGGCTEAQASPQLRLSFRLSNMPVLRAKVFATGLGIYSLHLNGGRVGEGVDVLTPGWSTVPTARVLANAYDVSAILIPNSENVFGVRLGQAKFGYVREFCADGDARCYAAVIHVAVLQATSDGHDNVTIISTASPGWQCAPSPITFNHLFAGALRAATTRSKEVCCRSPILNTLASTCSQVKRIMQASNNPAGTRRVSCRRSRGPPQRRDRQRHMSLRSQQPAPRFVSSPM